MSRSTQVLVFDSGVGGLSIISEIRALLPHISITYASDNAYFPYGEKHEADLIERVEGVLQRLVARFKPEVIVIACNTASTVALPRIRNHFKQAIIGVVPAIKPAAQLSQSKTIAVLATPGTIQRPYTQQLISDFAADCKVLTLGSSTLVQIAESKLRSETIDPKDLSAVVAPLLAHPDYPLVDTIVLACTHFPFLKQELTNLLGEGLRWVDSGNAIARRLQNVLVEHDLHPGTESNEREYQSVFTANNPLIHKLVPALESHFPSEIHFDVM